MLGGYKQEQYVIGDPGDAWVLLSSRQHILPISDEPIEGALHVCEDLYATRTGHCAAEYRNMPACR